MTKRKLLPLLILGTAIAACGAPDRGFSDDDDDDAAAWDDDATTGTSSATGAGAGGAASTSATSSTSSAVGSGTSAGGGPPMELQPGELVITEIMNNPNAVLDEAGEWFEIHNASSRAIDLEGAEILHQPGASTGLVIAGPVVIPAGGYAVLGAEGDASRNGGVVVDYAYGDAINLNNTADYLAIVSPEGTMVDETAWDELSGLDPDGASRSLDPAYLSADANDDDAHFCEASTAMSSDYGTPGAANDPC